MPNSEGFLKKNKKAFIPTIICVAGIVVGGVTGYFISNSYYNKKYGRNYGELDELIPTLEDDNQKLFKKFQSSTASDYTKSFKPSELVNIGYEKLKLHEYVIQQSFGVVNAMGVNQTVRATTIKAKDKIFMENLSASKLVQAAKRFYQEGNQITTYNANNIGTETADWIEEPIYIMSLEEHEKKWGKTLDRPLIYIVSSQTVLEGCTSKKTENGYEVELDLHPLYGVLRYVKQMSEISNIDPPSFSSIHIKYYFDEDLNLYKNEVTEKYTVVMVVKAESNASVTEYFRYDGDYKIPELKENLEYIEG